MAKFKMNQEVWLKSSFKIEKGTIAGIQQVDDDTFYRVLRLEGGVTVHETNIASSFEELIAARYAERKHNGTLKLRDDLRKLLYQLSLEMPVQFSQALQLYIKEYGVPRVKQPIKPLSKTGKHK